MPLQLLAVFGFGAPRRLDLVVHDFHFVIGFVHQIDHARYGHAH